MNVKRYVQWTITILLAGPATVSAQLKVDGNKSYSFSKLKTYTWGKEVPLGNSLWDQRIIDGVDHQLTGENVWPRPRSIAFRVGQLSIDIGDAKTKQPVSLKDKIAN